MGPEIRRNSKCFCFFKKLNRFSILFPRDGTLLLTILDKLMFRFLQFIKQLELWEFFYGIKCNVTSLCNKLFNMSLDLLEVMRQKVTRFTEKEQPTLIDKCRS